jgi:hypothetical protein
MLEAITGGNQLLASDMSRASGGHSTFNLPAIWGGKSLKRIN